MSYRRSWFLLATGLILAVAVGLAAAGISAPAAAQNRTIPTITPTPDPNATATPGPTNTPRPTATNTPLPAPTNTPSGATGAEPTATATRPAATATSPPDDSSAQTQATATPTAEPSPTVAEAEDGAETRVQGAGPNEGARRTGAEGETEGDPGEGEGDAETIIVADPATPIPGADDDELGTLEEMASEAETVDQGGAGVSLIVWIAIAGFLLIAIAVALLLARRVGE
ncbi:MAG: hypothetical protein R3272_09540 [Candidatus Promineifilaceae bacterium]|nr:hypothetical protein [Candidatus Promineifilaceae bacterium]